MRKRIDGHAHIKPRSLLGRADERFGVVMGAFGAWETTEGVFSRYAMPEYMETSAFPAEALIHVMDRYQVERAMVMQSVCLSSNEEMAAAVSKYPDRIRAAMIVVPRDKTCVDEIRYWAGQGLTGIKFEMNARYGMPWLLPDFKFDGAVFYEVCQEAEKLGLTVTVDPGRVGGPGYQPEALARVIRDFPSVKFVICHIGFPVYGMQKDEAAVKQWRQMAGLGEYENVWFDLAAIPDLFVDEGYPYPSAAGLIRELKSLAGAESLIWGTDVPGTYNTATYRQMIEMYEKQTLFSEQELDDIFYNNAYRVYFEPWEKA